VSYRIAIAPVAVNWGFAVCQAPGRRKKKARFEKNSRPVDATICNMAQPNTPFGLARIGQIAVSVSDLDRATPFYRDTLGMQLLFQVPNMAFFDCGGIRLMLGLPEKPGESLSSVIYYKVDEIQPAFEILSSRGVHFEAAPHLIAKMPDHELWMAFFRDPDRNLLALMCEKR
jgi:methylmalonyl-CoA/ethylmalonyl-CoA epimerase